MPHHTPLIGTIVAGLVVAFIMGAIAHRLKLSPLVGYMVAGIMVGPFTPGFVADMSLANELAEIGVILLMFGVGLHFSLKDLLTVKSIAVPGAIVQIGVATVLGMALAHAMGWTMIGGLVFGLALSVASTVVLLRALQGADLLDSEKGRIAVGWLIVEDLVMVLALVLLPPLAALMDSTGHGADFSSLMQPLLATLLKVTGFVALMLIIGSRLIPWLLHWVVHTGSRELFRLAVLALALGVAFGAAYVFHVSFALGAFFAGMILGETPLSRRAAEETLPLRDAFAVLFFVSVGMLFNPAVLIEQPLPLLATVGIIVVGKSVAAWALVRLLGHSTETGLTIAVSLAQIGEFSFILATLGTSLGVLPADARNLILAAAIISIFLNPLLFSLIVRRVAGTISAEEQGNDATDAGGQPLILIGYGQVGRHIAARLTDANTPFTLIESNADRGTQAQANGLVVIKGNALEERHLLAAGVKDAGNLLIAVPEGYEAGAIFEKARALNPNIRVIARVHSDAEADHLRGLGLEALVRGDEELATKMLAFCMARKDILSSNGDQAIGKQ